MREDCHSPLLQMILSLPGAPPASLLCTSVGGGGRAAPPVFIWEANTSYPRFILNQSCVLLLRAEQGHNPPYCRQSLERGLQLLRPCFGMQISYLWLRVLKAQPALQRPEDSLSSLALLACCWSLTETKPSFTLLCSNILCELFSTPWVEIPVFPHPFHSTHLH